MTVKRITFQVPDLAKAQAFYGDLLGFDVRHDDDCLIATAINGAELALVEAPVAPHQPDPSGQYWKIGLTLPDLDRAVGHLQAHNWPVSAPRQFQDIGYLCHLSDPAGLPIELLQQGFEGRRAIGPAGHDIGAQATVAHLTLRSDTRAAADARWIADVGLKLMSVQPVATHGFTLYFYAQTNDTPPNPDLTAIENREWLWRRPYTLVEVQVFDDGRPITPIASGMAGLIKVVT